MGDEESFFSMLVIGLLKRSELRRRDVRMAKQTQACDVQLHGQGFI